MKHRSINGGNVPITRKYETYLTYETVYECKIYINSESARAKLIQGNLIHLSATNRFN